MPMKKISIMTMTFGRQLAKGSLKDVEMLDALDQAGFDGVELPSTRLLGTPGLTDTYAAYLAGSRLEATCIDGLCNLIGPDQKTRDAGIDTLRRAIDLAASLGAPVVLAAGSRLSGDISPGDGRRMIADGLRTCRPKADEAGVALAIEDFGVAPTLQCAAAHCLEILNAVHGLAFVFDTGNFYFCGEDPLQNMASLAPITCHVHLKDWVKSDRPQIADVAGTALGTGLIPNQEIVRRFLESSQTDSFSIELGAPGDRLTAAKADIETVRQWISEGE